jgi:hypothetical protein
MPENARLAHLESGAVQSKDISTLPKVIRAGTYDMMRPVLTLLLMR